LRGLWIAVGQGYQTSPLLSLALKVSDLAGRAFKLLLTSPQLGSDMLKVSDLAGRAFKLLLSSAWL
jgi:hypothetical protein